MAILRTEVHSLAERQISIIPLIIPLFTKSLPPHLSIRFDLFMEDDIFSVVGTTRDQEEEL